jgi:hypothetical protein
MHKYYINSSEALEEMRQMAGLKSLDTGILSLVKLKDRFKGSSMALRTIQKQSIDIRCHKLEQGLQNVQGKTSQTTRK